MANPNPYPCSCGEMDGTCDGCRAAACFAPVPASTVTCRHGDSAALCILCRTSPLRRADKEKPQVDPLEFSLWLQAQDVEALTAWITQCDGAPADRESAG
jgi:hypothetical protein